MMCHFNSSHSQKTHIKDRLSLSCCWTHLFNKDSCIESSINLFNPPASHMHTFLSRGFSDDYWPTWISASIYQICRQHYETYRAKKETNIYPWPQGGGKSVLSDIKLRRARSSLHHQSVWLIPRFTFIKLHCQLLNTCYWLKGHVHVTEAGAVKSKKTKRNIHIDLLKLKCT